MLAHRSHTLLAALALAIFGMPGCGGSKPAPGASSAGSVPRIPPPPPRRALPVNESEPEQPAPAPEPEPEHPVGPWLEWQVADAPVITGKSYLRFLVEPGRGTVLRLASYDAAGHEEYPSLLLEARTPVAALGELIDEKLPVHLYIQVELDGNLLHDAAADSVVLVIRDIDGRNVRGEFTGQAHDVDTGGNGPVHGSFQAVMDEAIEAPKRARRAVPSIGIGAKKPAPTRAADRAGDAPREDRAGAAAEPAAAPAATAQVPAEAAPDGAKPAARPPAAAAPAAKAPPPAAKPAPAKRAAPPPPGGVPF